MVGSRISTLLRETVRAWVELAARDGLCAEVSESHSIFLETVIGCLDNLRAGLVRVPGCGEKALDEHSG